MARRRFQSPEPKRSGKWWYLLHWQDEIVGGSRVRRRKRIKLAPAAMPEREVKKIAAEYLRPLNQGLQTIGSATTFESFVGSTYMPLIMPLLASTTRERSAGVIKNYLIPAFGSASLRDMTRLALQRYFSGMVDSPLAYGSKDKIRDVLASILNSAVEYGLLVNNPAQGVRLPREKRASRGKPFVTPQEFTLLIALIPEPYATMVFTAIHTGLRISELVALKWRNVHQDSITIDERYCRGDWSAPKSASSAATIAVTRAVIDRLHALKTLTVEVRAGRATRRHKVVKSSGPDDLVFQSVRTGAPMRDNNILIRYLKPAGRKLSIGWVNWRCLRTSHATWLKMARADVKDIQAQMRHSRASTTMDIYMQFIPESQRRAINRMGRLGQGKVH